ncbi:MAG: MaoC family dehydratase [Kiloniellales bacterium]
MAERTFEDFAVGERFVSRSATFTEDLITEFAHSYDPQPFHIDRQAAVDSPFGGLIASGFQTLALAFRLFYDQGAIAACSMGSPGIDKLRWHRPVRPGDSIQTEVEVRDLRASESRSDRGYATLAYTVTNQDGEIVMTLACTHILRRRAAPAGTPD